MDKIGYSYLGLLQAFADALKLLLKEYVAPTQANIILFFLGPVITLIFGLLGYSVLPTIRIEELTIAEMLITINFCLFELTVAFIYIISTVISYLYLLLPLELVEGLLEIINIINTLAAPECIAAFATPISNLSVILFIIPYVKGNR